jgi:hypothetical protein
VIADRRQDVVQLLVLRARVTDTIGREKRQPQRPREIDERTVAVLFSAETVPLQLDREPSRKDRREPLERLPRGIDAAGSERPGGRALVAARQAPEPFRARRDVFERDRGLPLRLSERAGGNQAAEVPVAGPVFDEEGDFPSPPGGGRGQGEGALT